MRSALIIANTDYTDPGLAQLTAPGEDAEDFARVLKDKNICAFDEVNVILNQPEYVVRAAIDEFFDQKKHDDLLILYFSGHGVRDELGSLYLAVKNTIRNRLRSTAIKSDYIREAMDQSRSKRQVLILDCCNSGAFSQGTKAATGVSIGTASAFEVGYGRIILTASDSTQFAWEGDKVIGETDNSLFTNFLVQGLEGEADLDGDGSITVDELYDYAYEKVKLATPKQTPSKFSTKQQGEIVLRQNIRLQDIKPIALPDELVEATEDSRTFVREGAVQQLERFLRGKNLGLARSAREVLERMEREDDSRRVSQAATKILEPIRQAEKVEEERKAREEAERIAAQKADEERLAREKAAAEQLLAEQKAEEERKTKEEAARLLAEQKAKEEQKAREEVERKAQEEAERLLAEQKSEEERLAHEKAEAERKAKEEAEKLLRAQTEREAAGREAVRLKADREAAEFTTRQAAEKAAREKVEKETAELEAAQQAELEAMELATRKKMEGEVSERAEQEAVELAARKKVEREAVEQAPLPEEKKVAKPNWSILAIIGGTAAIVILCIFAATRNLPSLFMLKPSPTATQDVKALYTAAAQTLEGMATQNSLSRTATPPLQVTLTVELPIQPTSSATQFVTSKRPITILWIDGCDPRGDSVFCKESGSLKVFDQFYEAINASNADLSYKLPTSEDSLAPYDIVIANFCGGAGKENIISWLKNYVISGGSVIALGDNFCQGVGPINGKSISSAQAATLFTQDWGISFTGDDDSSLQWADPALVHPLTQSITKIYAFRHAYLVVQSPSQIIFKMGAKPFIGLYDQTGTVIAIPDIGFHWGPDFQQQIADSDNFNFWQNMFKWLAEQSRNKRK